MSEFIPVHIETMFRRGSERQYITNTRVRVVVHAIRLANDVPASAVVEYDRYIATGTWTRILEVVPISELWDTATPKGAQ